MDPTLAMYVFISPPTTKKSGFFRFNSAYLTAESYDKMVRAKGVAQIKPWEVNIS